ncbi:hypothetical protein LIER_37715 [Lithospermum erythrorhizon]|uniref:Uncharacterized protein n=1 Tax=Lithospermum erythrorhizon TaxID=34254 RepID=A0AAV3PPK3_LITER
MLDEYDRISSTTNLSNSYNNNNHGTKQSRLRLFLFPDKVESSVSSIESLLESSTKSEDWFLEALNGISVVSNASVYSESNNSSVTNLLGLDDIGLKQQPPLPPPSPPQKEAEEEKFGGGIERDGSDESLMGKENNCGSVPESPIVDKTSSFGSGSSMPALANLPPIRVHVEEKVGGGGGGVLGIEEQFHQMSTSVGGLGVGGGGGGGGVSVAGSSPSAPLVGPVVTGVPVMGAGGVHLVGGGGGEYGGRVVSDDERSDQGVPVGYRKVQQFQQQVQPQQPAQFQQKPVGFYELPSPDSVSSDGSVTNPLSRQRQIGYQEQIMHMQSGNNRAGANVVVVDQKINDPNNRGQMQQQPVQESEYVMPSVYEQHPQLHQQQQQQQFVHGGVQYIHPHTAGGVPIASYYQPMYHSQQQHHPHHQGSEQQYVYYMPPAARPGQAYNVPVQQQQSYGESPKAAQATRPQTPPHPTSLVNPAAAYNAMNVPASKPELAAGVYRTSATGAPQLVQVQSSQHHPQYVGYQMHHPSQSIRPTSAASASYAYDYAEPTHAQMYYTQPMAPQMTAQYQTVTSSPMVMLPGNASQVPTENMKQPNNSQL